MSGLGVGPAIDRRSSTLREMVQERLQEQIVTGVIPAGTRLNETEIAEGLRVSRGPVREAIQRLASSGLVVIEPHRGAHVRSLTDQDLRGLYELRTALETHAARLAARNETESFRLNLKKVLGQTSDVMRSRAESPYPPALDIHQAIAVGCGVPRLQELIHGLHQELALARARSGWAPDRAQAALSEHVSIVEAIVRGDEAGAAEAMYAHLTAASAHTNQLDIA